MWSEQTPCVLVIISDVGMQDVLADWLLSYQDALIFSSTSINCHGLDPVSLNIAEQVTARQRKLEFQIQTTLTTARDIAASLRQAFPGAHLRYWIQPVVEAGYLDPVSDDQGKGAG